METYYFDSFLELKKTPPPSPTNSPKIKLKIEFLRLEINSRSIMHTKLSEIVDARGEFVSGADHMGSVPTIQESYR